MSILPPSPFVSVSPGDVYGSLPSGESDPSVTLDYAPGESAPSMTNGGQEAAADANMGSASAGLLERILEEVLSLPPIIPQVDDDPPPVFLRSPSQGFIRALFELGRP